MEILNISRRTFFKTSAMTGGGLVLGFSLPGFITDLKAESLKESMITPWLSIGTDHTVMIMVPSSEMGQGVNTSLPMIIAEELDVDWTNVQSKTAPFTPDYNHPQFNMRGTGGSYSVRSWWPVLSSVGASAREMLVTAAANQWNVPTSDLSTENGMVIHPGGRKARYGDLAEAASQLTPPQKPKLKSPDQYRLIGKATRQLDTPAKTNGTAVFGIDVQVPGMLYATSRCCPAFRGNLIKQDENAAKAVKGVIAVVPVTGGVAVVADSYWNAKKGLDALNPQFDDGGAGNLSSAGISRLLREGLDEKGIPVRNDGDFESAFASSAQTLEAIYEVPFLAHATLEPMNCTAHHKGDSVELWAPTQGETWGAMNINRTFGIPFDKIRIHTTHLGGGFGRRFESDFMILSLEISKAVGKPVKLIYSREEDIRQDFYRPANLAKITVGLNGNGLPSAWKHQAVSPSISQRAFPFMYKDGVDPLSIDGVSNMPYGVPNLLVTLLQKDTSIPVGTWRAVGNTQNAFYVESMVDEIAHASNQDPYLLRRKLLEKHPRHRVVLDKLAQVSGWQNPTLAGRHRGIAIHESFGSIVGQVAEISINPSGAIRIHRMSCVVDCGRYVNPGTIEAQMTGGMIFGLTAALKGEITIKDGRVVQSNFHDYPMMQMAEAPEMDVHIIQNNEGPGGIGEPAVPPSMPSLTNAIFAATGKRIRSLPISKHDLV